MKEREIMRAGVKGGALTVHTREYIHCIEEEPVHGEIYCCVLEFPYEIIKCMLERSVIFEVNRSKYPARY